MMNDNIGELMNTYYMIRGVLHVAGALLLCILIAATGLYPFMPAERRTLRPAATRPRVRSMVIG